MNRHVLIFGLVAAGRRSRGKSNWRYIAIAPLGRDFGEQTAQAELT
jgi:hypothetical protein